MGFIFRRLRKVLLDVWYGKGAPSSAREPILPPEEYNCQLPDFVGLGAMKCGTTWWHSLITCHPRVYDSSYLIGKVQPAYLVKERHFFDRFFGKNFTAADQAEYAKWFARPDGMLAGEWTPSYLNDYWVPPLMKATAPNAKFIVILRDPIDRFVSGMLHQLRGDNALLKSVISLKVIANAQFTRGLYFQQLQRWLANFPRSQFLILQYEKCKLEPKVQLRRTFEFLDLPEISLDSINFWARKNRTWNRGDYELTEANRRSLIDAYRDDVIKLGDDFPEVDCGLWKNFQ